MVCAILSERVHIKEPLLLIKKSSKCNIFTVCLLSQKNLTGQRKSTVISEMLLKCDRCVLITLYIFIVLFLQVCFNYRYNTEQPDWEEGQPAVTDRLLGRGHVL